MIHEKIKLKEKIGYALGDGAANIAWRGIATFLLVFYTDVFGLTPVLAGLVLFVSRLSDGISDVAMGIVGDRTNSKHGKFRPWIFWTAIPLAITLSLLFTTPNFSPTWKIVYAFSTYFLFTLLYTANNIPYGALMAVMTGDDKERTSLGSFRMVGAFSGGMLVQGALLFLVVHFGNINPDIEVSKLTDSKYEVTVSTGKSVENVNIKTKNEIALFSWTDVSLVKDNTPTNGKSFSMEANKNYSFIVEGEENISAEDITIIDQSKGYSYSIYILSVVLAIALIITFLSTKERVYPPKTQKNNLGNDLKDLIKNKPWIVLLVIGLVFQTYNSIKQGVTVMYFSHFVHKQLLAGTYMVVLMIASIGGAIITTPIARRIGKRRLLIYAFIFSGFLNALIYFCGPQQITAVFILGILSEFGAAIMPTLFFAMLGDAADYSEYINGRRATGLIYSAGSFSTKFGGGIAGIVIGTILSIFHYNGQDSQAIAAAIPGIKMLMSWVPAIIALLGAGVMMFYPLNQKKMDEITIELNQRRKDCQ